MKEIVYKADSRGHADHGWLKTWHSFSFASYYDPERMHFGVLRVLNDDTIAPGMGFSMHPHDNMEIITIPLSGDLEHRDDLNNSEVIREGDIQVMSAGTGVYHSEFNHSKERPVKLFQIWLFPNQKNLKPRYDQISIRDVYEKNAFYQILSPDKHDQGVWIHQDAWFHMADLDEQKEVEYSLKREGNGIFLLNIEGKVEINSHTLESRDAIGIWGTDKIRLRSIEATKILLMDIPMN